METFLIRALQLILSLSILVFVHEFGHFAFARLFKVRVEKFYMFFNPHISLFRLKKVNGKWQIKFFAPNVAESYKAKLDAFGNPILDAKGKPTFQPMSEQELADLPADDWRKYPENTEWGLGWLPLGGYCKIAGMIDESSDSKTLQSKPQPWEYRAQPTWKRLPIIIGGVLVNFIAALVIYASVLFTWGQEYLPLQNADYGMQFSATMLAVGFDNGDKILRVDDKTYETRGDVMQEIVVGGAKTVTVLRNNDTLDIYLPQNFAQQILAANEKNLMDFRWPFVVKEVVAGGIAAQMLLQEGDQIVAIAEKTSLAFFDVQQELAKYANDSVVITYIRNNQQMQNKVLLGADAKLGVQVKLPTELLQTKQVEYTFLQAIPAGISLGWETLTSYIKQFKLVLSKEGAKQLGGFGAIGSMFPKVWDWQAFWGMTALLSIMLAFMNILPIPALDGGHVVFLLYEMITKRKPSDKFMEYTQTIGMLLLFALLVYANLNDIIKLFL